VVDHEFTDAGLAVEERFGNRDLQSLTGAGPRVITIARQV